MVAAFFILQILHLPVFGVIAKTCAKPSANISGMRCVADCVACI